VTKAKRRLKRELGIGELTRIANAPKNVKPGAKRKARFQVEPMKFFGFLRRLFK
jgi:hypothetical protein